MVNLECYGAQAARLPSEGCTIVASFDEATIVVYQAYHSAVAQWAVAHQRLGGPHFKFTRMSWIKPSFLWMMYRSGWATKRDQERVLAIRIPRATFDELVRAAVPAQFDGSHGSRDAWGQVVKASSVRVQWDPDRDPLGAPLARRAIQLGLRGDALARLTTQEVRSVTDVTTIVHSQRDRLGREPPSAILIPRQDVYPDRTERGS